MKALSATDAGIILDVHASTVKRYANQYPACKIRGRRDLCKGVVVDLDRLYEWLKVNKAEQFSGHDLEAGMARLEALKEQRQSTAHGEQAEQRPRVHAEHDDHSDEHGEQGDVIDIPSDPKKVVAGTLQMLKGVTSDLEAMASNFNIQLAEISASYTKQVDSLTTRHAEQLANVHDQYSAQREYDLQEVKKLRKVNHWGGGVSLILVAGLLVGLIALHAMRESDHVAADEKFSLMATNHKKLETQAEAATTEIQALHEKISNIAKDVLSAEIAKTELAGQLEAERLQWEAEKTDQSRMISELDSRLREAKMKLDAKLVTKVE